MILRGECLLQVQAERELATVPVWKWNHGSREVQATGRARPERRVTAVDQNTQVCGQEGLRGWGTDWSFGREWRITVLQ